MARGEEAVRVRAEAVERDVPEVEQAGEADDDVQREAEQDVQEGEDAEAGERVASGEDREEGRRHDEETQAAERREPLPDLRGDPGEAVGPLAPALDLRHPLVDADARPVAGIGALGQVGGHEPPRPS